MAPKFSTSNAAMLEILFSKDFSSCGRLSSRFRQALISPFMVSTKVGMWCCHSFNTNRWTSKATRTSQSLAAPSSGFIGLKVYVRQRERIAGLIFSNSLPVSMTKTLELYVSISCLMASCAEDVRPSASSIKTIFLSTPTGFVLSNVFNSVRTKSIPLSSEPLVSKKLKSLLCSPSISLAITRAVLVLPVPGGPTNNKAVGHVLLAFQWLTSWTKSLCPTMSVMTFGLAISLHMIYYYLLLYIPKFFFYILKYVVLIFFSPK